MNFTEHNRRLFQRLRYNVLVLGWILVPVIFGLEVALLATRTIFPAVGQVSTSYYVKFKLLLPSVINLVTLIVATVVANTDKVRGRVKNWVCCFAILIVCSVIAVFHREFEFVIIMPCAPILFSTIFADKPLVGIVSIVGGLMLEIATVLSLLSRQVTVPVFITSIIISIMVFCCCYMFARLMMKTTSAQMAFVFDSYSAQEDLIDELHIEPMTGLSNRTALDECLALYIQKYLEGEFTPHLVLMDIDHFKYVNDTYGHNAGDVVIKNLSAIIRKNMNGIRRAFRFGGDEMVLLFGNETLDEIKVIIENIRNEFKSTKYNFHPDRQITLSVGVSTYYKGLNPKSWFELTDSVMYKSKEGGRDAVNFTE